MASWFKADRRGAPTGEGLQPKQQSEPFAAIADRQAQTEKIAPALNALI